MLAEMKPFTWRVVGLVGVILLTRECDAETKPFTWKVVGLAGVILLTSDLGMHVTVSLILSNY